MSNTNVAEQNEQENYFQLVHKLVSEDPMYFSLIKAEKCPLAKYHELLQLIFSKFTHPIDKGYIFGVLPCKEENYFQKGRIVSMIDFNFVPTNLHHHYCNQAIRRNPFELEFIDGNNIDIYYHQLCELALDLDVETFRFIQREHLQPEVYLEFAKRAVRANKYNLLYLQLPSQEYNEFFHHYVSGGDGEELINYQLLDMKELLPDWINTDHRKKLLGIE